MVFLQNALDLVQILHLDQGFLQKALVLLQNALDLVQILHLDHGLLQKDQGFLQNALDLVQICNWTMGLLQKACDIILCLYLYSHEYTVLTTRFAPPTIALRLNLS